MLINNTKNTYVNLYAIEKEVKELNSSIEKEVKELNGAIEKEVKELNGAIEKEIIGKKSLESGDINNLSLKFTDSKNTGIYLPHDNTISIVSNKNHALTVTPHDIIIYNNVVIKDNLPSMPIINEEGHLYKKQNEKGLFWSIKDLEKDLTEVEFPLCSDDGNKDLPSYSFKSSKNTGMYKIPLGGIGFSVNGNNIISIEKNKTHINNIDVQNIEATDIKTQNIETTDIKTQNIEATDIKTQNIEATDIKTQNMVTKTIHIDDVIINSETLENICNPVLKLLAGSNIEKGDIVCIDNNERAIKAIGGKWFTLSDNLSGILKYVDNDKLIIIKSIETNEITEFNAEITINKYNYCEHTGFQSETLKKVMFNCAKISDVKVIKIENNYLATWSENNIINLLRFGDDYLIATVDVIHKADKFNITYDNDNIILVVYSSEINNISICIIDITLNLLALHNSIIQEPIIDTLDKNINIINTPGHVIIISFGNRKIAVVISDINNIITGEILIDYESYDCVDMHYNINNGIIISIEKTNANTCFIEVLDILGTKIQKLNSKKFGNVTMIPHSLAYNINTDTYLLFFNNKVQVIKYFDDKLELGLWYQFDDNIYGMSTNKLFYSNNNKFLCLNNTLLCYIDGYEGLPSAYVGVSNNKCSINDICNITIKGRIYDTVIDMPNNYIGNKLYLCNVDEIFPYNLSINKTGVFIGTCINKNKLLIGL